MCGHMAHYDRDHSYRNAPRFRRRHLLLVLFAVLLTAGAGYWGYGRLTGDEAEDPRVTAAKKPLRTFLDAWEAGDAEKAGAVADTPGNAASLVKSVMTNLKPSRTEITLGEGEKRTETDVRFPFTVEMTLPGAGDYSWDSQAQVRKRAKGWEVMFSTPMIHPKMVPGQTLALKSADRRAAILDATGEELEAASLTGVVDEKTGKGASGLEAEYDEQLSGGGAKKSVVIVGRQNGNVVKTLTKSGGKEGRPVKTTIDPDVQEAAAKALDGVEKEAAIVAVDPSDGSILAAANKPGGMNRALAGRYPPGSTFKVVTAAALLKAGMSPADQAACPKFTHVDGQRYENQDQFTLPEGTTFRESFAKSCNTFFVSARGKLSTPALHDTAAAFGIGGAWDAGVTTYDGSVPVSTSDNDKAAATIGQGRVQASPLVMASVAATVKQGEFRQPVLVPAAAGKKHKTAARLEDGVLTDLRAMMRAAVTDGAASALGDIPGEPHAKTGTAEFGEEKPPRTHAWMIGYQGDDDLAWSVLLADGGSGGADAGPVAARFLANLG